MKKTPDNNELYKPVADMLFSYLRDMSYDAENASLDTENLPEAFADVAKELEYLNGTIIETKALAKELAAGNLHCTLPPASNKMIAPLKSLYSSLKHLTWQAQIVAKGNYSQRVDFMGDFSIAFNDMIMQLKQRAQESTEEKTRLKGFLATMSHEIRTPLNAILGMVELSLREEMSDAARAQNLTIKHASINLLSIINDILDFSKIESGKMEIVPREYLLSSLINDTVNIIKARLLDSHLRFVVNVDSNLPSVLNGDAVRIRQIMLNLLSNAVKYTDDGYIAFMVSGEFFDDTIINLIFTVEDSGKGISKENLETLFDEFSQFDLVNNAGIEGTGLGLSITRNLVKAMNGEINVESVYGEGSAFTVSIPQIIANSVKVVSVEEPEKHNILIFERREVCVNSIIRTMVDFKIRFKLVSTSSEFYNELENNKYSFVFLAASLYEKVSEKIERFKTDTNIVLIAEYGEVVSIRNISILTSPIFSIPLANILNGVYSNYSNTFSAESGFGFLAPDIKVLVVDDIKTNLAVAQGLLEPYNMQADVCTSGIEAIKAIEIDRYDLIFMDQMMPVMDGVETVAQIRVKGKHDIYYSEVPIIAFTANAVSGTKETLLDCGFNDFLAKPIDALELNTILEKWIPDNKKTIPEASETAIVSESAEASVTGTASEKAKASVTTDAAKPDTSKQSIEIEGIDMGKGLLMSGGVLENYKNVLFTYHDDASTKIDEIKSCLENSDIKLFTTYVHALKSASASIGASDISVTAEALEKAGLREDVDYIDKNTGDFLAKLEKLLGSISEYLSSFDMIGKPDEISYDVDALKSVLLSLKSAFDDFDTPVINETVKNLQNYMFITNIGDKINKIMKCKITGDYDEAVSVIEEITKSLD